MQSIRFWGHCCLSKSGGWVDCVETHGKDRLCSEFNIHKIRQQFNLLAQAYIFALDHMNHHADCDKVNKTWADCCDLAVRQQPTRMSKASNKAGKGNIKVCCRFFGSAGGLMSGGSMNIKSSKMMTGGIVVRMIAWRLCWHHALILPTKLQNCKQRGKDWR
jgi:hypothetical protein